MPMSYPDLDSLKRLCESMNLEYNGESEPELRKRLYDFIMSKGDIVWAQEIKIGKGWDEWEEDERKDMLAETVFNKFAPPTTREPISPTWPISKVFEVMAEDNILTQNLLSELFRKFGPIGIMVMLNLDDMNMRGKQVWCAYSSYCKQDISKFKTLIENRDKEMVEYVNKKCVDSSYKYEAVVSGKSFAQEPYSS